MPFTPPGTQFYPTPLQPPSTQLNVTQQPDTGGRGHPAFIQMLTQLWSVLNGANVIIPCVAGGTATNITLAPMINTPQPGKPGQAAAYFDYMTFSFISPITTTGATTIQFQSLGALAALKLNGSAPVGNGDMVQNLHYLATFVDTLNGFVVR